MSSQEIVTLQVGTYSNYVGTHFWNSQFHSLEAKKRGDCYEEDSKLFREKSTNQRQSSHVPRMISFDFKNKLHALKLDGTFRSDSNGTTNGKIQPQIDINTEYVTYAQNEIKKKNVPSQSMPQSSKQNDSNIEASVNTWSDFMNYTLDGNSIQSLRNRFEDESKFLYHGLGYSDYADIRDDIDDKLHYWVEECNSLEGFMIFTNMNDAFCGLTSKLLYDINDEYKNQTVLPFINWPSSDLPSELNTVHCLNTALTFQSFAEHSSMFVLQSVANQLFTNQSRDIAIPNVSYTPNFPYHSSAILASAIDSITSPWKWTDGCSMWDVCQQVTKGRWKLTGSAVGFPVTSLDDISLFERMSEREFYGDFLTSLFPHASSNLSLRPMSQSIVFQDWSTVDFSMFDRRKLQSLGLIRNNIFNPQLFLEYLTDKQYPPNLTSSQLFYQKNKADLRYPFSLPLKHPSDNTMSSLFTSTTFYDMLSQLISNVEKIKINKLHSFQEYGLDEDTHKILIEDLYHLAEEYNIPSMGN